MHLCVLCICKVAEEVRLTQQLLNQCFAIARCDLRGTGGGGGGDIYPIPLYRGVLYTPVYTVTVSLHFSQQLH